MGRYILHYQIDSLYGHESPDIDTYEYFSDKEHMHKRVNELAQEYKERFSIGLAAYLQAEYKYNPTEIVVRYDPEKL